MKNFWRLYKATFTDFSSNCKEAGVAALEFGEHLVVLTLPITFPLLFPLAMLWKKVKPHG